MAVLMKTRRSMLVINCCRMWLAVVKRLTDAAAWIHSTLCGDLLPVIGIGTARL